MAKYSFVIPTYNGMPYIQECISSILNQTNQDFEIIILESCSNDGTKEYLESIKNDKVKILNSNTNLSIEENWQRILHLPKNQYLIITGQDDSYLPNYLEEIDKLIQKHPNCSIYRTNMNLIDSDSKVIFRSFPIKEKINVYDYIEGRLRHTYFETAAGYCIKSTDYEKIGGIDCKYRLMHTDDKLMMELIMLSGYMAVSPLHCANYRTHPASESGTPNTKAALAGYFYYFNWMHSLNDKKINKIIKKYLPYHLEQIDRFFTKEQIEEHKKIYKVFKINPNSITNKFKKFLQKILYIEKVNNKIKIRILLLKISFKYRKETND